MTDRYVGKPFLRLLDSYVLWSIGQLDHVRAEGLKQIEPKLQEVYGQSGSWQDIVAGQMEFPASLSGDIKGIWERGRAKAREQGLTVDPLEFTKQFVDTNFPTAP
jgi:hypothetical protein